MAGCLEVMVDTVCALGQSSEGSHSWEMGVAFGCLSHLQSIGNGSILTVLGPVVGRVSKPSVIFTQ